MTRLLDVFRNTYIDNNRKPKIQIQFSGVSALKNVRPSFEFQTKNFKHKFSEFDTTLCWPYFIMMYITIWLKTVCLAYQQAV